MRIVFFGTSTFGLPSLEALRSSHHTLAAVVSTPDTRRGRSLKLERSPVKEWALNHSIRLIEFDRNDPFTAAAILRDLKVDVFVVISFGVILSKEFLDLPQVSLNVHSSLLPLYRGPAPMQWALLNGDSRTGVTVMRMAQKLDAGDILLQKETAISPEDNLRTVEERLSQLGAGALMEALTLIEKKSVVFTPQEASRVTYARKITKEDGRLDWKWDAHQIIGRVHALAGWPGTFFFSNGKRILVLDALANPSGSAAVKPGSVLDISPDGILVNTGNGAVLLKTLQQEGRKPLPAGEFARGFRLTKGAFLE